MHSLLNFRIQSTQNTHNAYVKNTVHICIITIHICMIQLPSSKKKSFSLNTGKNKNTAQIRFYHGSIQKHVYCEENYSRVMCIL